MMKSIVSFLTLLLFTLGCTDQPEASTDDSREEETELGIENDELKRVKEVALSFYSWNIESILDETHSIEYDFGVSESEDGNCKIDSVDYFRNLRSLGTISEKFIQSEWDRVSECSTFLSTLDWEEYRTADAYKFQDWCDLYSYYWTRTQEPFHGVEVKEAKKVNDRYLVTLVFFYQYDEKHYSEYFHPVVEVQNEKGAWKITEISWLVTGM